jgi:hypothetical protein
MPEVRIKTRQNALGSAFFIYIIVFNDFLRHLALK